MPRSILLSLLLLLPLSLSAQTQVIEDFSRGEIGKFPAAFRTYPFQRGKASQVYLIRQEGGDRFLQARVEGKTQQMAVQVFRKFPWDLSRSPRLSWRWRARALPKSPTGEVMNDNACAVYVVFGGFGGKALKYSWSSDQPVGTTRREGSNFFETVLTEGAKKPGEWETQTLNVVEEYQRFFHQNPKNPSGIGLLTDGDGTGSPAICDYDDFKILAP